VIASWPVKFPRRPAGHWQDVEGPCQLTPGKVVPQVIATGTRLNTLVGVTVIAEFAAHASCQPAAAARSPRKTAARQGEVHGSAGYAP